MPLSEVRVRSPSQPPSTAGWVVAVLGTVASLLLAAYVSHWEQRSADDELRERVAERAELLDSTVRVSMQVLYSLKSLHAAAGRVEAAAFARFARDARSRHPELQALEWAPRVSSRERGAFESAVRAHGYPTFRINEIDPDGRLVAADDRPAYFPVEWIEPMAGNEAAHGLDLARDASRRQALERARVANEPAATAPVRLAQERGDQAGVLALLPLSRTDASTGPDGLEGFVVAVFRAGDLIVHAMRGLDARDFRFTIDDVTDGAPSRLFATDDAAPVDGWMRRFAPEPVLRTVDVAGRQWRLSVVPRAGFVARHLPWQAMTALVAGLLVTAFALHATRANARGSREVAAANAALRGEAAQREQAVQAALDASTSKSTFLAHMSHEIRTPMNAILGYAQVLRRDPRLEADQRDAVNTIVTSGSHLIRQINEVLDFSKIESGSVRVEAVEFDLDATLRELERLFGPRSREKRLALKVVHADGCDAEWVVGDRAKLQQILINLLGNAVRFTSVGEVALKVSRPAPDVFRFDVIDTGPGIAAAEIDRVFEPFYQASSTGVGEAGSGLGLAIARRQAALLGGTLVASSEPGVGSVFTLTVPLPAAHGIGEPAADIAWRLGDGQRLAVLVIDDGVANRDVLIQLLRQAGIAAEGSDDPVAAIGALDSQPVDVVFVDIRLPGIDGFEVLARLKRLVRSPRVIAYTTAVFDDERRRLLDAGFDAVVGKPLDPADLFETLARVSGRRLDRAAIDDSGLVDANAMRIDDVRGLSVAPALIDRMLTAAELHSATVLKACLAELEAIGPDEARVARRLRQHLRAYDMVAITHLLMEIPDAASSPAGNERHAQP